MSHRSFLAALLASIALHALLLGAASLARLFAVAPSQPSAAIRLEVRLPPARTTDSDAALLKNTLADVAPPASAPVVRSVPVDRRGSAFKAPRAVVHEARRKLAEHLFYPPEAIALGLEGEVRLLLRLAPDGVILDVGIASGSGHALLDHAAIEAALAMRRLPDAGASELILPVVFALH